MRLEKAINPLLDDNDQVALTFILDNIVNNKLKIMAEAWPFLKPVNKKNVKDYYSIIKNPMDLGTIAKKVAAHKYHNRRDFLADMELIYENSLKYNGKNNAFTEKAEAVVRACKADLEQYHDHLTQLERNISLVQERHLEQSEADAASWMGPEDEEENPEGGDYVDIEGVSPDAQQIRDKKHLLEEDLQFSSEEEMEEMQMEPTEWATEGVEQLPQDESQQAAMAMVQLGGINYYTDQGGELVEIKGKMTRILFRCILLFFLSISHWFICNILQRRAWKLIQITIHLISYWQGCRNVNLPMMIMHRGME